MAYVWYGVDMLNEIIKNNPAPTWAQLEFRCNITTPTGHNVRTVFKGNANIKVSYEDVIKGHGKDIKPNPLEDYGEYLCVASQIATKLNAKIEETRKMVKSTVFLTVDLLHALSCEDYVAARECMSSLSDSLKSFNQIRVKAVWSMWTWDVMKYLDSRNPLKIDEMM